MKTLHLTLKGWNRYRQVDEIRREALERLYVRREAVDDLIRSLENYQRVGPPSSSASCCTAGASAVWRLRAWWRCSTECAWNCGRSCLWRYQSEFDGGGPHQAAADNSIKGRV